MREHLRISFSSIRRAPFQATAAVMVLTITFFVSTLLAVLTYSSHKLLVFFETRPQIIAFLKNDASNEQIDVLMQKLKDDERVESVGYVAKEEALEIYKEATKDNPLLAELVSPSIFPASVEFSVKNLEFTEELFEEVKNETVVDKVSFSASVGGENKISDVIGRLTAITRYVRLGGAVVIGVLAVTSFLVLMVVIGMRITMRRSEVESLSLIGATNWFIRLPIVFEAVIYSFMGVLIGWMLAVVLLMYVTPSILNYFGSVEILPRQSVEFFGLMGMILLIELAVGLVIALIGSLLAVSRSLRV